MAQLSKESIKFYYENMMKTQDKSILVLPGSGNHKLVLNGGTLQYFHNGKLIYKLNVLNISGNYELFN